MKAASEVLPMRKKAFVPKRDEFSSLGRYLPLRPLLHIGFPHNILFLNKRESIPLDYVGDRQVFSVKGQGVNILSFEGHTVFVTTT